MFLRFRLTQITWLILHNQVALTNLKQKMTSIEQSNRQKIEDDCEALGAKVGLIVLVEQDKMIQLFTRFVKKKKRNYYLKI